jgi:hypothetical protein
MQRLATIARQNAGAPTPREVIASLVTATFTGPGKGAAEDLAGVVQTDVAERLMLLALDEAATPEVQAAALQGVDDVRRIVRAGPNAMWRRLDHEIGLFLSNPRENAPRLKPSGAPPGPPI